MMQVRRRYFFTLAALILASPALAETPPVIDGFTLANGLEVVVIENHRVPVVSHMLWYRVGAADDPPGKSGLAHYHEHMMYQGTARYPAGRYADLIESRGGAQNAFTGADATAYYATVAKDDLPLVMALEADRMRGLSPRAAAAEKEKQVVLEERLSRVENSPEALLSEQMNAALFRHHPYRLPVIGWAHEIRQLTRSDALKFHAAWYRPGNAVLVLSGDITAGEARPLVEKYYGGLTNAYVFPHQWNAEPAQSVARTMVLRHANVGQPVWARYYAVSSLGDGRKEAALPLLMLSQLLGGGQTSRLYQSLVKDKEIASEVEVGYDAFVLGPSRFRIVVKPAPGVSMEKIGQAVDAEIAAAFGKNFPSADVLRAKTLLKAQSVYARDGLSDMARIMGWIRILGLPRDYFMSWPQHIEAVTPDAIADAVRTELTPERSVTGWLLPEEKKERR